MSAPPATRHHRPIHIPRPHRYPAGGIVDYHLRCILERDDQGKDLRIPVGHHLIAPGRLVVIVHGHDAPWPNGFGDTYPIVRVFTGRFSGGRREPYRDYYLGHANHDVPAVGRQFRVGEPVVALTNQPTWLPGGEQWGWCEWGRWVNGGPPQLNDDAFNGKSIAHLFRPVVRWS